MTPEQILDEAQRMPEGIWDNAKPRLLRELRLEVKKKVDKRISRIELATKILSGYVQNPQYTVGCTPKFLCEQALIHTDELIRLIHNESM